jgi:DNA-binding MarR family transcriptional regulator
VEQLLERSAEGGSAPAGNGQTVDFGPLADLAGFMLRLAQLQVFEDFYAEFGPRGIRPGQVGILLAIERNPGIRQGVLAEALHVKRSNMAKIVRSLVKDGLIERRTPADDGRAVELRLARAGRDLLARLLPDIAANDRAATAGITAGERATLMRLLHKMVRCRPEARP